LAIILHAQGQSDEALRLLREQVLPIFERMGAQREREATEHQIAAILAGTRTPA
jgi:hypothetical protein